MGERNRREFPWCESNQSFYEVFVAEFFLTQTPADNVDSVYPEFLRQFPDLEAIRPFSEAELKQTIEPLGFHNIRSDALKEIADDFQTLPRDPDRPIDLPCVGRYVANTTVCFSLA